MTSACVSAEHVLLAFVNKGQLVLLSHTPLSWFAPVLASETHITYAEFTTPDSKKFSVPSRPGAYLTPCPHSPSLVRTAPNRQAEKEER